MVDKLVDGGLTKFDGSMMINYGDYIMMLSDGGQSWMNRLYNDV